MRDLADRLSQIAGIVMRKSRKFTPGAFLQTLLGSEGLYRLSGKYWALQLAACLLSSPHAVSLQCSVYDHLYETFDSRYLPRVFWAHWSSHRRTLTDIESRLTSKKLPLPQKLWVNLTGIFN